MIINNAIEIDNLNKLAEKVEKPEDAANIIIKQYEENLQTKRKGIIAVAYHQGKLFKRFKEKEKFMQMVSNLKTHKSTLIFKINIFKLIEKVISDFDVFEELFEVHQKNLQRKFK